MIFCENVSKCYSDKIVTDSFCHRFNDTGFYLLVGESGSGKTTMLNILSGLIPFDEGMIRYDSKEYRGQVINSEISEYVDYITQDAFFVDFLDVMDNLRLITDDDGKIIKVLERFGLEKVKSQMPKTLSGGEKQRLAIARAVLNDKKVLLLDEPTASLDEENKLAVFEMLKKLKNSVLIICSTHDRQAEPYADEVIAFHKGKMNGSITTHTEEDSFSSGKCLHVSNGKKDNLNYFLKKWFHQDGRSRKTTILFDCFLVLALVISIFADLPEHKETATLNDLYRINILQIKTCRRKALDEKYDDIHVVDKVLSYAMSCPDGNENLDTDVIFRQDPGYEVSLNTLPYNSKAFMLSDRIKYGTYFTGKNQIIISSEMADALYPGSPERMVGQKYNLDVYKLGNIEFEIVGVFDKFTEAEKKYLQALDIGISSGDLYNPEDYEELYFVNSLFTEQYGRDESFYMGKDGRRTYYLYFDSYKSMKKYYEHHKDEFSGDDEIFLSNCADILGLRESFSMLFCVTMPAAVFLCLFSTLFFTALKKNEFMQSSRFVAVFEYSGYNKRAVLNRFVMMNILEMLKVYGISLGIALGITGIVNLFNRYLKFINFEIFTYNFGIMSAFLAFMTMITVIFSNIMLKRVKVNSWYENLIESRDLI